MSANIHARPEIKYVSPDHLTLWEKNPRLNDEAVPAVMASIEEFGFLVPVVIDQNMVVMAGNTRLKAALRMGLKEIPVVRVEHLSDKQMKAFALADNKTHELSKWDLKGISGLVSLADLPSIPGFKKEDVDKIQSFLIKDSATPNKPMAQGSITTMITCPHCGGQFEGKAVKKSEGK